MQEIADTRLCDNVCGAFVYKLLLGATERALRVRILCCVPRLFSQIHAVSHTAGSGRRPRQMLAANVGPARAR